MEMGVMGPFEIWPCGVIVVPKGSATACHCYSDYCRENEVAACQLPCLLPEFEKKLPWKAEMA
jgi:hypothetical protein